jgi:hypothetical protein
MSDVLRLRRDSAGGSHSYPEIEIASNPRSHRSHSHSEAGIAVSPNVTDDAGEFIPNELPDIPPRGQRAASCDS